MTRSPVDVVVVLLLVALSLFAAILGTLGVVWWFFGIYSAGILAATLLTIAALVWLTMWYVGK